MQNIIPFPLQFQDQTITLARPYRRYVEYSIWYHPVLKTSFLYLAEGRVGDHGIHERCLNLSVAEVQALLAHVSDPEVMHLLGLKGATHSNTTSPSLPHENLY